MKFLIQEQKKKENFSLIYDEQGAAFDIEPYVGWGFASILINFLQLEFDDEGRIGYVWGYCPLIIYQETDKVPQNYECKNLVVQLNTPLIPGISYRINKERRMGLFRQSRYYR